MIDRIKELKERRNAVILAHNYQPGEVQDAADFVGDSLELSIKASEIKADVIVFCGVYFMAETAKILSPSKTVVMPDVEAGCPMADMITKDDVLELKKMHPRAQVVCYVNSSAEVKAHSDICCTSANAESVVNSITGTDKIIFIPDKYLGMNTAVKVRGKEFIYWNGFCPVHAHMTPQDVAHARMVHPNALVMVHPECRREVVEIADSSLSTGGMLKLARETKAREIVVGTEIGMLHRLRKENPDKRFHALSEKAVCRNMKKTTIEKILWSLEDLKTEITVPEDIADKARTAIEKMLVIGRQD